MEMQILFSSRTWHMPTLPKCIEMNIQYFSEACHFCLNKKKILIYIYIYICIIYKTAMLQKGRVLCFYGVCFFYGCDSAASLPPGGRRRGFTSASARDTRIERTPSLGWRVRSTLGTLEQISALFSSRFATSSTTTTVEDKGNGGIYI